MAFVSAVSIVSSVGLRTARHVGQRRVSGPGLREKGAWGVAASGRRTMTMRWGAGDEKAEREVMSEHGSKAQKAINENKVMVFATTTCPFCVQVKQLFKHLDVPFTVWHLDTMNEGPLVRDWLLQTTGQRTVPNVFVSSRHVGGCDETYQLYEQGKLESMLNESQ